MNVQTVLITGSTGYIGGRLVPELLKNGYKVRCLARTPSKLDDLSWRNDVEVVAGDLNNTNDVAHALEGIDVAYFLVHSMASSESGKFQARDVKIARQFAEAAQQAGVQRIIYLGGLGEDADPNLSPHLKSRHEVGETLRSSSVPVVELRAAVIIGSGSASFEMLRNLVEILPVMITPKWVRTKCQPIAIRDVLFYLSKALEIDGNEDRIIEIGGPDVLAYRDMMQIYAQLAHLKHRLIITVPLLTPHLSSHWVGLVTPLPTSVAKPLVHGLQNEVVVHDHNADELMPHKCLPFKNSIELAIQRTRDLEVTTSWADADLSWRTPADPMPTDPTWSGGKVLDDTKVVATSATASALFKVVTGIGGKRGWLVTDRLWEIRGWIDKLVGGVGMRRGRRHPYELRVGDALDFWRVEAIVPNTLLRLRAEMRLPGRAWLEWTIDDKDGERVLTQRARYQPRGLAGRLYWYSLLPFHAVIFKGLAAALVKRAETNANEHQGG